jgi:SAM-dependent methyltransferase
VSENISPWVRAETVRGFAESPPNQTLLDFARAERVRDPASLRLLDLGCGAGRNAQPLADSGWQVHGIDTSHPMLLAAAQRGGAPVRFHLVEASMDRLPFADRSFQFIVAQGVWNLGRTDEELRRGIQEAARVARPDAALFVFTFSRTTLAPSAIPRPGQHYAFDQFSGTPQIFLTAAELVAELGRAGFQPDPAVPLREHNRPTERLLRSSGPVIYEGSFRFRR